MVAAAWNPSTLKLLEGTTNKICTTCCGGGTPGNVCGGLSRYISITFTGLSACSGEKECPANLVDGTYILEYYDQDIFGETFKCKHFNTTCLWLYTDTNVTIQLGWVSLDEGYGDPIFYIFAFSTDGCCNSFTYLSSSSAEIECGEASNLLDIGSCGNSFTVGYGGSCKWRPGLLSGWALSTYYASGTIVGHNGEFYVSKSNHTSTANDEPGVGVNWATYWDVQECP